MCTPVFNFPLLSNTEVVSFLPLDNTIMHTIVHKSVFNFWQLVEEELLDQSVQSS